jgi:hypothetical protein
MAGGYTSRSCPRSKAKTLKPSCGDRSRIIFRACSKRFFESVPNPGGEEPAKRRIQLTCRYQYDLNKPANENDLLVIMVPIVMAPPFDFTIPDGKNPAGKSFSQSLTEAIKTWLDEGNPSGKKRRFVFGISVYSSLDPAKLPVYRLSNLQLGVKKDRVKDEWVFSSTLE